jgi:quercetin dioxygenase-like cupin family protein
MTEERHEIRVLVTGVDAAGKSCVVSEDYVTMDANAEHPGFWFAGLFQTPSAPPPTRPDGHGEYLETELAAGLVRWQVIDYGPSLGYPMHHTDTVDIDIVLQGSIELTLDDGTHLLETGDGVIINGVDHAWKSGPDGCRLSVTFIGTPPRN